MTTRAERAFERTCAAYPMLGSTHIDPQRNVAAAAIRAYEAELAADLEKPEVVARFVNGFLLGAKFDRPAKISQIDESMVAALKRLLEER